VCVCVCLLELFGEVVNGKLTNLPND